jgi:hypothetical protein
MAQCTEWAGPRAKAVRRNAQSWGQTVNLSASRLLPPACPNKKARLQEDAGQEEPAQEGRNQGFLQPVVRLPITITV